MRQRTPQLQVSLFQRSLRNIVFSAFGLLAVLPVLALVRIGTVLFTSNHLTGLVLTELIALVVFVVFSLCAGLRILIYLSNNIQSIAEESDSYSDAIATPAPGQWVSNQSSQSDSYIERAIQQPRASQNELESLTSILGRLHLELETNLDKLRKQAFYLENLEIILENCGDMVVILDNKQKVLFTNRLAKHELGLLPEREIRHCLAESMLAGNDYERCASLFESWDEHDDEIEICRLDGVSLTLHVSITITRPENDPAALTKMIVLRDITSQKRLERQLYRSEKLASLGQLIAGVAHELNNPLAAILGFAELCRGTHKQAEIDHNLEIIEREAKRTAYIVDNLLNFSRQRSTQRSVVDIHELLERCLALLAYNFRTSRISVRRDYAPDMPELEIDEFQIQQVFMNIILNAAQAMDAAETTDRQISLRTGLNADNTVSVEIADNGPGISPRNLKHIFDPFFTTKKADQGTGLGLPVSLSIVRNHGGKIITDTTPGQGASFKVIMPLTPTDPRQKTRTRVPTARKQLSGKVLIVDDEPAVRDMTQKVLADTGLQAESTNSVKTACHMIDRNKYNLILVDVHMPDGAGTEVWRHVQETQPQLTDKVIFMTGDPKMKRTIHNQLGIDPPMLLKPFHITDLQRAVDTHLGTKNPRPEQLHPVT